MSKIIDLELSPIEFCKKYKLDYIEGCVVLGHDTENHRARIKHDGIITSVSTDEIRNRRIFNALKQISGSVLIEVENE